MRPVPMPEEGGSADPDGEAEDLEEPDFPWLSTFESIPYVRARTLEPLRRSPPPASRSPVEWAAILILSGVIAGSLVSLLLNLTR